MKKKQQTYNVKIKIVNGEPQILHVSSLWNHPKGGFEWKSISGEKLSKQLGIKLKNK